MVTDLGEQPTPEIQPAEPPPGGVDAVEDVLFEERPVVPDLSQIGNEGSKGVVPDEVIEPDDNDTAATRDGSDVEDEVEEQESPA
jgi:hypothetical protein